MSFEFLGLLMECRTGRLLRGGDIMRMLEREMRKDFIRPGVEETQHVLLWACVPS